MIKSATFVAALLTVLSRQPQTASAAAPITVGDGTASSCTEAALRDALIVAGAEGGGTIQFACGADPVTITVTATLTVPNNTRIDGDRLLTLDGQSNVTILRVDRDTTATINHLTIYRGGCTSSPSACGLVLGGGIYNAGTLTVHDSTFAGNGANVGGGIYNTGTLMVRRSTFSGNVAFEFGGGIYNTGTLTVHDSTFAENSAGRYGSGIFNGGVFLGMPGATLTVHDSTFAHNFAGYGGGICNCLGGGGHAHGSRQRVRSQLGVFWPAAASWPRTRPPSIAARSLATNPQNGGGIGMGGVLTVYESTFSGNAARSGGGISGNGTLTVHDSAFDHNSGYFEGGGIAFSQGILTVSNSIITQNTGAFGGGLRLGFDLPTLTTSPPSARAPSPKTARAISAAAFITRARSRPATALSPRTPRGPMAAESTPTPVSAAARRRLRTRSWRITRRTTSPHDAGRPCVSARQG